MTLNNVKDAKAKYTEAKRTLADDVKQAITTECARIFVSSPDITSIGWGAKVSEYNDEGMYPGINGPFKNVELDNDDHSDLLQGYGSYQGRKDYLDDRLKNLSDILNEAGEEILCQIWGDEDAVIIKPLTRDIQVEIEVEHLGW